MYARLARRVFYFRTCAYDAVFEGFRGNPSVFNGFFGICCLFYPFFYLVYGCSKGGKFQSSERKTQNLCYPWYWTFLMLKYVLSWVLALELGDLWGNSNFWVCGRNPMMWPFKWKLSTCTFTWCYLFVKILENEIWKFGRNLPLATFGSERVNSLGE